MRTVKKMNNKGTTLVELVVAFAVLAIIVAVALNGFALAADFLSRSVDLSRASDKAKAEIDMGSGGEEADATLNVYVNGTMFAIDGKYIGGKYDTYGEYIDGKAFVVSEE